MTADSPLLRFLALFLLVAGPAAHSTAQTTGDPDKEYPVATPTEQDGIVISPYPPGRLLDVSGLEAGSLALDPSVEKIFRIPYSQPSSRSYEDYLGNPANPSDRDAAQDEPARPRTGESVPPPGNAAPPRHSYPETDRIAPPPIPDGRKPSTGPTKQPAAETMTRTREYQPLPRRENRGTAHAPVMPAPLRDFLYDFNEASSSNDPAAVLPYYAQKVDSYFGKKNWNRHKILRDRAAYIARYPFREYIIDGEPVLLSDRGGLYEVLTRVDYSVRNIGRPVTGTVADRMIVERVGNGYQILSIEEAKAGEVSDALQREDAIRREELAGIGGGGAFDQYERGRIELFVEAFTASGEVNDPSACVDFMHPQITRYYNLTNPSRDQLLQDRRYYINRWPNRRYWLIEAPRIQRVGSGEWLVTSRIGYEVSSAERYRRGEATSTMRLGESVGGLRILSITES